MATRDEKLITFLKKNLKDGDLVLFKKDHHDVTIAGKVFKVIASPKKDSVVIEHPDAYTHSEYVHNDNGIDYSKHKDTKFYTVGLQWIAGTTKVFNG